MISEVFKKGCVKDHVKMGFIQSSKIEDIFEKVQPSGDFDTMKITDWIQTIDEIFSS
jgi:hypothetical protein